MESDAAGSLEEVLSNANVGDKEGVVQKPVFRVETKFLHHNRAQVDYTSDPNRRHIS